MSVDQTGDIPLLDSVQQIGLDYDAWLVDLWGVMHNGETAIHSAVEACERYREEGGIVLLITNAPRPQDSVREQIMGYGVPPSADDGIISSGDVTRSLVAEYADHAFFHIGPERDRGVFDGFNVSLVEPDDAEIVLLSGLYDDSTETPEDYRQLMMQLAERDLPMICANPDVKVERGADVIYAAGAVAALYEQLGGQVIYAGKPHGPIYDRAVQMIAELAGREIPRERILAIGDGVNTDIKGAAHAGIDALFIPSAVHVAARESGARITGGELAELFRGKGFRPLAALPQLQW